jgi:hypothetical protein
MNSKAVSNKAAIFIDSKASTRSWLQLSNGNHCIRIENAEEFSALGSWSALCLFVPYQWPY